MTPLSRTRAIALVISVGLLGACGESDSRQRNSALTEQPPNTVNIPVPMSLPESIALSGDSVLVASGLGGPIARINKDGTTTTSTGLEDPVSGLVANEDGTFFVANQTLNRVRKIGLEGQILENFYFDWSPNALYRGVGDSLIVVLGHRMIVRITNGQVEEVSKISEMVREIDVDSRGNIYFYEPRSEQIVKIAPDSTRTVIQMVAPISSFTVGDDGSLYAVEHDSNGFVRLAITKTDGSLTEYPLNEQILGLTSLTLGRDGTVYITDTLAGAVHRVLPSGEVNWKWATTGEGPRSGVVTDAGDLYIVNLISNSVTKITPVQNSTSAVPSSSEALRTGLVPKFGPVQRTRDGFTVQITNYDPNFAYFPAGQSLAMISVDGILTVYALAPGMAETITVKTSRPGYEDGSASITGRAHAGVSPPADEPSDTSTSITTPRSSAETSSSVETTSSVQTSSSLETSSSVETSSSLETSSSVDSTETPASGEPAEVVQTQAESGTKNVLAVPSAVVVEAVRKSESSTPVPVLVSPEITEIVCEQGCLTALLAATDMFGATVTASVPGVAPVAITLDNVTPIAIGSRDTAITFELTDDDGKKVAVEVPVVHDESVSYLTADAQSESSNRTWLIALLVLALVILVVVAALRRRRSTATGDEQESQRV